MRKSYKYRIYPNKEQTENLIWTLDRCREVYNAALQERRDRYNLAVRQHPNYYDPVWRKQATKDHAITCFDQQNELCEMKQERTEYLSLSAAHLLNDVCKRVDFAFQAFFRRVKAGQTPGYPRFMSKHRYDSFCYPDASGWKIDGKRLCLTRIGDINIRLHRPITGKVKTCTVKREGDQWYVIFSCEVEPQPLEVSDQAVGIDLGLLHLATLSTGETIEHPRYYRKGEKKLEKLQQALSRKKRGSHRRHRAVKQVAKAHRKVRNQRKDFLHKESRKLVDQYGVIVFEDLQAANMSKRPKPKQDAETGQYLPNNAAAKAGLNKSILDAGWAEFVSLCTYKAECAGRDVLTINPRNTSRMCSACGAIKEHLALADRIFICEACGNVLDRDLNAAINILALGKKPSEAKIDAIPMPVASQTTDRAGQALRKPRRVRSAAGTAPNAPISDHPSQGGLWAGL